MRSFPVIVALTAAAALAGSATLAPWGDATLHVPVWALFSFAVSAFREPLR